MEQKKVSASVWISIILFGLFGQIAWIVENMYFNVFIDRTISPAPVAIWVMVAASAIVATFATLVGGTWSDRKANRRFFISYGYIIWGLVIMSFSFIKTESVVKTFSCNATTAAGIAVAAVVIMDCVMTYIGSTANDAAFNAWVTDNIESSNRGKIEGVLAVMPLLAMAAVFGGLDWMTQDTYRYLDQNGQWVEKLGWIEGGQKIAFSENWTLFFVLLGSLVLVIGVIGLFIIKDKKGLTPNLNVQYKDMFYGFKKQVIKENKNLYLTYIAMTLVGIANNCYMAYLIMYVERTLGFSDYIVPVAVIIVTASIGSVVFGIFMDKSKDRRKFLIPLVIAYVVGAMLMYFASPVVFKKGTTELLLAVCLGGFVLMVANLCISAALTATVRDLTPPDKIGLFQGVRMFFWVMLPMVIGPLFTVFINLNSPVIVKDTVNNMEIREYSPLMFIFAAVIGALAVLPVLKLNKADLSEMKPFGVMDAEVAVETEILGEPVVAENEHDQK
jgi:Major Facilitator Superfamily.